MRTGKTGPVEWAAPVGFAARREPWHAPASGRGPVCGTRPHLGLAEFGVVCYAYSVNQSENVLRLIPSGLFRVLAVFAAFFFAVAPAPAKRLAPKPVTPVVAGAVEYSAPHEQMGFVVATDTGTHKELWRERIYTVHIDPKLERDVQDVFITSLVIEGGVLVVTNERGESYALDLATRKVTKRK